MQVYLLINKIIIHMCKLHYPNVTPIHFMHWLKNSMKHFNNSNLELAENVDTFGIELLRFFTTRLSAPSLSEEINPKPSK